MMTNNPGGGPPESGGPLGSGGGPWHRLPETRRRWHIYEIFEIHRQSVNRYINQYFDCLDRVPASASNHDAEDHIQVATGPEASDEERNFWRMKISRDSAVRDLKVMDELLVEAKENETFRRRIIPWDAAAWTFLCSAFAFMVPNRLLKVGLGCGALAGAVVFTLRLTRMAPPVNKLELAQHKVRDVLQSFENDMIRHRKRDEVEIPLLE